MLPFDRFADQRLRFLRMAMRIASRGDRDRDITRVLRRAVIFYLFVAHITCHYGKQGRKDFAG